MPEKLIHVLTNLGDSAVTGALALSLVIHLLMARQRKAALAVVVSYAVAALVIAVGKIAIYSRCNPVDVPFDIRSPSGHAALSMTVYGMCAALVSSSQTGKRRIIPYLVAAPLVALIALSRIILNYHTVGDVVVGLIVGACASLGAGWLFLRGETVHCRWKPFALVALVVLVTLCGLHFPAEALIGRLAWYVRAHIHAC